MSAVEGKGKEIIHFVTSAGQKKTLSSPMRNRTLNVYAYGPMLSLLEISAVVKLFIRREYSGT